MQLEKIVSGGQTGVDQASLEAAMLAGIQTGGWCPPGRTCESGLIPDRYKLFETPGERSDDALHIPRSLRTEWNVRDADGTLLLIPNQVKTDAGCQWTLTCARRFEKPYLVADPFDQNAASLIKSWIGKIDIRILNVAGPSEKKFPGIGEQTIMLFTKLFSEVN